MAQSGRFLRFIVSLALVSQACEMAFAQALSLPSTESTLTHREDGPDVEKQPPGAPEGWGTKYMEWNLPKNIYVPGDPIRLTDANKSSGRRISFVACPVLMDSQPTPLWLAVYNGETYFLRAQQNMTVDVNPPQLLHKVLVEGVISDEPPIAGGIVLNPLKLSVLREVDTSCHEILPARPGYSVLFAKKPPGPGVSSKLRYQDDDLREKIAAAKPLAIVGRPEVKSFEVPFDFDSDFTLRYQPISEAAQYARSVGAARIEIRGYRASSLLSNGQTIVEYDGIDKVRADKVRLWLIDYAFPADRITISLLPAPLRANGINDFMAPRATIVVTPEVIPEN